MKGMKYVELFGWKMMRIREEEQQFYALYKNLSFLGYFGTSH